MDNLPTSTTTQKPHLVDTHCHLDFDEFEPDRQRIIQNASQLGIKHIVVPAITQQTWHQTITLCQQYPNLHLALGLHPVFIEQHQSNHLAELEEHIQRLQQTQSIIGVGEVGLDFYLKGLPREKQLVFFEQQLIIANRQKLPVIIHNRKAHDECIKLLSQHSQNGGIIHAFNGSLQQAHKYIDLGFLLGFGGMLTYERSSKLKALAKAIPLTSIVLETDAPDMTVAQHQGQRNSPEYLPLICDALADIKNQTSQHIATISTDNFHRVFHNINHN